MQQQNNLILTFLLFSATSDGGRQVKKAMGVSDKVYNEMLRPIQLRDTWSVLPMILRPYSKGYLRLKSKNPFEKVLIYPNYITGNKLNNAIFMKGSPLKTICAINLIIYLLLY